MELDRRTLDKILSLDDRSLSELTEKIAQVAGADAKKTEELLKNLDFVRSTLSSITVSDAEKLLNAAGKDKSEQILSILNGRGI